MRLANRWDVGLYELVIRINCEASPEVVKSQCFSTNVHVQHAEVVVRQHMVGIVSNGVKIPMFGVVEKIHALIK